LTSQKEAKNIAAVYDTSLEPGQGIPLHFHNDLEEIYYILSGYGIMTIGDEKQEISRNDVVYIPKTAPAYIAKFRECAPSVFLQYP